MRPVVALTSGLVSIACAALGVGACSSSAPASGFAGNSSSSSGGGSGSSGGSNSGSGGNSSGSGSGGNLAGDGGESSSSGGDASVTTTITIYAHTDNTLYSVDPMTNAVKQIGPFSPATTITDLAVNAKGEVYVNSETAVFKATLPSGGTGSVALAQIAAIQSSGKFFALAFAPVGALDPNNEVLLGGDGSGVVWAIDTSTGATTQLGNFGSDPSNPGNTLGLSGDLVFYDDAQGAVGLATIRSCSTGGSNCSADWLAGVDMNALKTAYTTKTPATTLLGGVYGGSSTSLGQGTGYRDVFGLGAWNSKVFGFTRSISSTPATLITIDTTSGAGTMVSNNTSITKGWSGAGVTTKVTVNVPPPPPPPK